MRTVSSHNSLNSMSTSVDPSFKIFKKTKKYNRIGSKKKKILLEKVFFENKKIKTAAEELGINYSTAKTIFHIHRKKFKKEFTMNNAVDKSAGYRAFKSKDSPVEICVTQGGRPLHRPAKNTRNPISLNELLDAFAFLIETVRQEQTKNEFLTEGLKKICMKDAIVIKPISENGLNLLN